MNNKIKVSDLNFGDMVLCSIISALNPTNPIVRWHSFVQAKKFNQYDAQVEDCQKRTTWVKESEIIEVIQISRFVRIEKLVRDLLSCYELDNSIWYGTEIQVRLDIGNDLKRDRILSWLAKELDPGEDLTEKDIANINAEDRAADAGFFEAEEPQSHIGE